VIGRFSAYLAEEVAHGPALAGGMDFAELRATSAG
jgi:hypothetical protein